MRHRGQGIGEGITGYSRVRDQEFALVLPTRGDSNAQLTGGLGQCRDIAVSRIIQGGNGDRIRGVRLIGHDDAIDHLTARCFELFRVGAFFHLNHGRVFNGYVNTLAILVYACRRLVGKERRYIRR